MTLARTTTIAAFFCAIAACGDDDAGSSDVSPALPDAGPTAPNAGTDAIADSKGTACENGGEVTWCSNGGEDIPEYSLGRLLISHVNSPELVLYDFDTSMLVARLPFSERAELEAGGSGRYAYVYNANTSTLHVFDPGQWLLSHIDHFHVIRGEHRMLSEQLVVPSLRSLSAYDGWVIAYANGSAAIFQERSITARIFSPSIVSLGTSALGGAALVSRAQLIASDGVDLTQRWVLEPEVVAARFAGCTEPRGIAAHGADVYVGCAEALLNLRWDATEGLFLPSLLPVGAGRVLAIRTTERFDGALLQVGPKTLAVHQTGSPTLRSLELASEVLAFELRRQGTTALAITADGNAHELDLAALGIARTTAVLVPNGAPLSAHLALSHAYAYVSDPIAPRVRVLRLRTMQIESDINLPALAHDLAVVGVPGNYIDDRE